MIDQEKLTQAAKIIKDSNYMVVFLGAGISKESGVDLRNLIRSKS